MFCPKCGEKNKEGAQFCTKCGEKFEAKSNSKTTKSTKTAKITTDDVKELTKEVTKEMTNEASSIVRDMISKPIDSLKKYGEEKRFNLALVLVGIMSVLVGLFIVALMKNVYSEVMSAIGGYYGNPLLSMARTGQPADIPYFKMFLYSTLATYALSFVFVGILYFVNNVLFKGTENFKKMYVIYSIISVVVSVTTLASLVLSFMSVKLAAIVLSLGFTLSSYYVYHMIKLIGPKDENKHGYVFVTTSALFYLAIYIIISLLIKQ